MNSIMSNPNPLEIPRKSNSQTHLRHRSLDSTRSGSSPIDPLSSALSAAQAKYTLKNQTSLTAHNAALHHLPGGNTRTVLHASPFPITWEKGEGSRLTSVDGDVYIDFLGEFTAGIFGHSNEAIREAVEEAMKKGWNFGGSNVYEKELARKVVNRFSQSGLEYIRFCNSGTEANMMALATAVTFTGRQTIIVFTNSYHGSTLTFPSSNQGLPPTNLPHKFVIAPYNDISGTRTVISAQPPDSIAAILVEGVQGSGGAIAAAGEFLQYLNSACTRMGALFIMDEVMTSRLSYHGYSASMALRPDLMTLGKWVGGGMSFGAFGGRKDVMQLYDPRTGIASHSGTFNNNVISMAAGIAGLDILTEEKITRLNSLGDKLIRGIEEILAEYKITTTSPDPQIPDGGDEASSVEANKEKGSEGAKIPKMSITGVGSMICIHFNEPPLTPLERKNLLGLFFLHMLEENIYMATRGFISLNIEIGEEDVEKFLKAVERFVGKYRLVLGV